VLIVGVFYCLKVYDIIIQIDYIFVTAEKFPVEGFLTV